MRYFPDRLLRGYRSFITGRYSAESVRYRQLAEAGQQPHTLVIACCDSRAAPETIFDCGPGELFVVRNVANLVPPYGADEGDPSLAAALEFAVQGLRVQNILVMGHGRCGGIRAVLTAESAPLSPADHVGRWMNRVETAAGTVSNSTLWTEAERQTALERISIRISAGNLRTFPWVHEREEAGELSIHGAWFDIASGELWVMDSESGDFGRPELVAAD